MSSEAKTSGRKPWTWGMSGGLTTLVLIAMMIGGAVMADWRKARECSATINTVKIVWPRTGGECRAADVLTLLGPKSEATEP